MVVMITSAIGFVCLLSFFIYELNQTSLNSTIKALLAILFSLPALKMNSVLFVFEAHFVVFTLLLEFCFKKLMKTDRTNYKRFFLCIPIPFVLAMLLMCYGSYNMNHIVKTEYTIDTQKSLSKDYKIAMISDLHYPNSTSKEELSSLVKRIAKEKPDFVMLCGDIIDEIRHRKKESIHLKHSDN